MPERESSLSCAAAWLSRPRVRLGLLGALLLAAILIGLWGPVGDLLNVERWRGDGGVVTPLLFAAVFGVAALLFVPRPALATAAGALFSVPVALCIVVAGTVLGAGIAFGLARMLGRDAIAPRLGRGRLEVADSLFARHGFTATVVCRLLPLLPFAVINYAAGVTRVRATEFLAGTAVGTLPANVAYVLFGGALVAGADAGMGLALVGVGAVGVLALLAWLASQRMAQFTDQAGTKGSETVAQL